MSPQPPCSPAGGVKRSAEIYSANIQRREDPLKSRDAPPHETLLDFQPSRNRTLEPTNRRIRGMCCKPRNRQRAQEQIQRKQKQNINLSRPQRWSVPIRFPFGSVVIPTLESADYQHRLRLPGMRRREDEEHRTALCRRGGPVSQCWQTGGKTTSAVGCPAASNYAMWHRNPCLRTTTQTNWQDPMKRSRQW